MKIPRPGTRTKESFASVVPDDPRVKVKPMFGNDAAFVNGNLFMGVFGDDMFFRLSDDDSAELHGRGGSNFEPMKGRPMKGYVLVPRSWLEDRETLDAWAARSLKWVAKFPPKASAKSARK